MVPTCACAPLQGFADHEAKAQKTLGAAVEGHIMLVPSRKNSDWWGDILKCITVFALGSSQ